MSPAVLQPSWPWRCIAQLQLFPWHLQAAKVLKRTNGDASTCVARAFFVDPQVRYTCNEDQLKQAEDEIGVERLLKEYEHNMWQLLWPPSAPVYVPSQLAVAVYVQACSYCTSTTCSQLVCCQAGSYSKPLSAAYHGFTASETVMEKLIPPKSDPGDQNFQKKLIFPDRKFRAQCGKLIPPCNWTINAKQTTNNKDYSDNRYNKQATQS